MFLWRSSAVLVVICLSIGEISSQGNQRTSSSARRVSANGRPFEIVQTRDGRRMLVFLEEGGGRRQVQTLSPRSLDVAETFPPNPDSLSRRQREGLESLRRDLARLVRRRTNWSRYTVSRGRDGVPDLGRRRSSRQRALSRDDAIHMIRVISRYLSGNLVTTSQTTRSAATEASSLFTSMMTSPVTSALRRSSTTIHPSSSTRTTTLRPVSIVTSPRPTTSRLTTSEKMMTQLREEEQKLIRLLQTTTSPITSLSTDGGITNSLPEKERQLVQELANLERTTLLPSTAQVRQTLPPRESTLNETRNEIAKIKLDLQRVKNALLQRLRRGDLTNERNTQRRSEFSRLQNMEQSLTNRLETLQTRMNQMMASDRRIQPITKSSRDEVMRTTKMMMNRQRSVASNPVNQMDANTRLESVLQSLEKTLSRGEQLLLIRVLGEIERGVQIHENNAQISLLLGKLESVMTSADFTFIRNLILGEQSNMSSTLVRNEPQNNSPLSVSGSHSSSTFQAEDVDKIANVVQTNLQPQEQEIIMRLFSSDNQISSHLLQHPSVRPILQKLQQLLTFSEYKTFESLINGQTEPKQQGVPMESNVISNTNVQTPQPSPQLVQHLQHSSNIVQQPQQQNQQHHLQQQHMQQQHMQQQHMQQLNALNNLSPSTSEFVGQQPMIQHQNQIPQQQSTHLAGQTGFHRMMNPAMAARGLHGFGMNPMGLHMFPRLPSAMMQELMFGDTTDPPEIPTPTTAAPVMKETLGVSGVSAQALKVPAMDQKMSENIPYTTPNPVDHVGNHSVDITSHLSNIMNVLKNSGMPKNVKLEFHLPQNTKKEDKQKTQSTFEKKDGNSATLSNTLQMVQAPKIFPYKVGHNVQTDSNSNSKDNIVINNHQSQVFIPLLHPQENNSSNIRVQIHDTQPKNKPVFALSPSNDQLVVHNSMNGVHNLPQKTQFEAIRETPIVYQNQLPPGGTAFQNNIPQSKVIMKTSNLMKTKAEEVRPFPLRQPPKPQSIEELEQFNKLHFQVPLKQLDSQSPTHEIMSPNENERNRVPPRPSESTFHIPNLPERNFIPLRKRFLSNLRNEMVPPSDHEHNRIPPKPSDSTFPVQNADDNNIISQPVREEPSNSILGPISLSLLNNQKHVNLEHDKFPPLANPVGFVNDKMESKSNTNLNQEPVNNQNIINYNTDFASNTQAVGIPVTMPPQQLTSFSVPTTNQFLRKANDQTMKWDEVTSKKVETSANNQIKNIIMNAGGNVHTSFWDTLIEKTANKSGSSSNSVIKINLDSNMLKSPLFNTQTTTNNNNNVPNVEEEVEAEDIQTTTTTTTTTTMKPNEEFRMEIHTNQDGVSKISIIPQTNPSDSKASTNCSPSSEDFNCFGKSPFDSVKSIGTWCLAKCLQGSCIETVCSCSCDKKHHSSTYHSQVENMASALSTGKNTDSNQIQSTLNEIYSSLRETAHSSSNTNNVPAPMNGNNQNNQNNQNANTQNNNNNPNSATGDSMNVQFLLRSIEGMIESKLRMMAPRTTPKPEEEIEAEDLQKPPTPSNNWNNNENHNGNNGNNMNNNWNNNGNNDNNKNDANNNWNNNGNNNNNANNNWNNNGNNGNNWNNNNNFQQRNNENNNGNWNNNQNNNWNNNQNNNWNNNGNSNGNNWNNNGNNNWNSNWHNGNNWQNNSPGPWQNGNWNNGPNNSGWNGPPPNWTQRPWSNGGGGGSWGGANNQWNNWGGSGNWNMAFSRRNPWQSNGGGEGGEAAD